MLEHWLRIMSDLRSMSSCRVVARCCLNVPRKRRSASRSTSRTFCNRVAFFDRSPSVAKTKRSCAFFLRNRALFKRLSAAFRPLLVAVFFRPRCAAPRGIALLSEPHLSLFKPLSAHNRRATPRCCRCAPQRRFGSDDLRRRLSRGCGWRLQSIPVIGMDGARYGTEALRRRTELGRRMLNPILRAVSHDAW